MDTFIYSVGLGALFGLFIAAAFLLYLMMKQAYRSAVFVFRVMATNPDEPMTTKRRWLYFRYWLRLNFGLQSNPDKLTNLNTGMSAYWPGVDPWEEQD